MTGICWSDHCNIISSWSRRDSVNLCFAESPYLAGLWSHQATRNIHDSSLLNVLKWHAKHLLIVKKSLTYVTISASAAVVSIEYSQVHYLCSVRSVLQQKLPGSLGKPVSPPKMLINTSKHICCAYSYNSGVCRCEVTVFKSFIPWVRIMYQREHVIQSFHGVLDLRGYKGNVGK